MVRKWIQSAEIILDDATGAVLVTSATGDLSANVAVAANATQEIIATPGAGKQIWVYGYHIGTQVGAAAGSYALASAANVRVGPFGIGVNGGAARDGGEGPLFKCGTAEALNCISVTTALVANVHYRLVAV